MDHLMIVMNIFMAHGKPCCQQLNFSKLKDLEFVFTGTHIFQLLLIRIKFMQAMVTGYSTIRVNGL